MALADTKLAATIRNLWHLRVAKPILDADTVVAQIRAAIVGAGIADQFTTAEKDAMLAVESALNALAALPGVTAAANQYRPGHRTEPQTVGLDL